MELVTERDRVCAPTVSLRGLLHSGSNTSLDGDMLYREHDLLWQPLRVSTSALSCTKFDVSLNPEPQTPKTLNPRPTTLMSSWQDFCLGPPQVLPTLMHGHAASQLLVGALWELPGMALGLWDRVSWDFTLDFLRVAPLGLGTLYQNKPSKGISRAILRTGALLGADS